MPRVDITCSRCRQLNARYYGQDEDLNPFYDQAPYCGFCGGELLSGRSGWASGWSTGIMSRTMIYGFHIVIGAALGLMAGGLLMSITKMKPLLAVCAAGGPVAGILLAEWSRRRGTLLVNPMRKPRAN